MIRIKRKNSVLFILFVLIFICTLISIDYWLTIKEEKRINIIGTNCLDVEYNNKTNDISLTKSYQLKNEEGLKQKGYEFTIINNCDSQIEYNINLESLNEVSKPSRLQLENINVSIDDLEIKDLNQFDKTTELLGKNISYDSRILLKDKIEPIKTNKNKQNHIIKLWLKELAPSTEINKIYKGKIIIYGQKID